MLQMGIDCFYGIQVSANEKGCIQKLNTSVGNFCGDLGIRINLYNCGFSIPSEQGML